MAKGAARQKITSAKVETLVCREKNGRLVDTFLWDSELVGFAARVLPSGSKGYWARFRTPDGRQRWSKVGDHPTVTAEQARKKAKEILGGVSMGNDPAHERDLKKAALTIREVAAELMDDPATSELKPGTVKEYQRQFDKIILPEIGKFTTNEITYSHLSGIFRGLKGTPILSNRVHALLNKLFHWAEKKGYRERGTNPCLDHEKARETSRERFLSDSELESLGAILDKTAMDGSEPFPAVQAIRMLLFSGMRLNEVLMLQWKEVDEASGLLRLTDTKSGTATVDINLFMGEVLGLMKAWAKLKKRVNPYVFPGHKKSGHLVGLRRIWIRILKLAGIMGEEETTVPVRIHDVRRTFGTVGASDAALPHETIGKILRHKQTSTTQIYARLASSARKDANIKIAEAMANKLGKARRA